ncbi:uncharacterized protein ACWYII_041672 [Salvelinus alpinus]
MAAAARRRHGNMPQRRATLLPRGFQRSMAKQVTSTAPERQPTGKTETTSPNLVTTAGAPRQTTQQPGTIQPCGIEMGPGWTFICKAKMSPSSSQQRQNHPDPNIAPLTVCQTEPVIQSSHVWVHSGKNREADGKDRTTLASLGRIRIHPESQRILGSSCVATVRLERLRIKLDPGQSVALSMVPPLVSLVSLLRQPHSVLLTEDAAAPLPAVITPEEHVQQTGSSLDFQQSSTNREESSGSEPGASGMEPTQIQGPLWTEPPHPQERPAPPLPPIGKAPESDLVLDLESESESELVPGLKSGSDSLEMESDLEPKSELNLSMELDPKSESETKLESDWEPADGEDSEGGHVGQCAPIDGSIVSQEQPENEKGAAGMESEDFCAVCFNGGDLLCCDGCPKVYHLSCHIPPLRSSPLGDWVCTLCRSDQDPGVGYDCETIHPSTDHQGAGTPYTLSSLDQRRCEKLTLLLSSHVLSAPFQEPVSPLARHYYQIIKRPIDLSVIRRKLDQRNTLHYFTAQQFVDDVLLMFRNCATFNYPDSEVANAGRNLEVFFLSKLREVFPSQAFPTLTQDRANRNSLAWLNRTRRDYHRKKKRGHFLDF